MKRKSTLLGLCIAMCFMAQAKIWRVNNNTGVQADFTTLQAAHDGASSGDTLHVEGSPTNYGSVQLTKKLTLLGPGYYLAENPNTQAFLQTAKVTTVYFYVGSEGSSITGFDFDTYTVEIYANDIVVRKNNFARNAGGLHDYYTGAINTHGQSNNGSIAVTNIIIAQNYGMRVSVNQPSSGILITGNYIGAYGYLGDDATQICLSTHQNANIIIENNIFRRGKVVAYNSAITNNIMYAGTYEGSGNLASNNLCSGTQFPASNNNKQNVDMSTVFVGVGTDISTDGQWKLKAGSPALGAGYGSTNAKKIDAGMFSGNTPYVLSGMPSMPAIYFFENQPVGSNSDPINVSIKVRSAGN
jgi:hypothetical protein